MTTTSDVIPVVTRADHIPGPPQGSWTYEDYVKISEDGNRYEILNGVLYMTPAPHPDHQDVVTWFGAYLKFHIQLHDRGKVYVAPLDVELTPDSDLIQPDVVVILSHHLGIITGGKASGAPDLVVEVASPGTATYDRRGKMDAYAAAGVPEYWIPDPIAKTVELFVPENGVYQSLCVFQGAAILPSRVIPDFNIRVEQFFKD